MSARRTPLVIAAAAVMVLSVVLAAPVVAGGTAVARGLASPGVEVSIGPIHLTGITPDAGPYTIITPSCTVDGPAPLALDGLTFEVASAFTGAIVDECANSVLDGQGYTITPSSGSDFGVQVNTTSGVTVEDVVVGGTPTEAVDVANSTDTAVVDATSSIGMTAGVFVTDSSGVNISDSQLNQSAEVGIGVALSSNISVWDTYAMNGLYGFEDLACTGITITNLDASDNQYGILLDDATNVMLANDDVTGASLYGAYATSSDNLTITQLNASHSSHGVGAQLSDGTTVVDSNLSSATNQGFIGVVLNGLNISGSNLSGAGNTGAQVDFSHQVALWGDAFNASLVDGVDLENVSNAAITDSWGYDDAWNGLRVAESEGVTSRANVWDNVTDGNGTQLVSTSDSSLTDDEDSGDDFGVLDYGSSELAVNGVNSTNATYGFSLLHDAGVTVTNSSTLQDVVSLQASLSSDLAVDNFTGDNSTALGLEIGDSESVSLSNAAFVGSGYNPSVFGAMMAGTTGLSVFNVSFTNFELGVVASSLIDATFDGVNVTNSTGTALMLDGTSESTFESGNLSSSGVGFSLDESGPLAIIGNTFYNDTEDFEFNAVDQTGVEVYWNNFVDDLGWSVETTGVTGTNINFADGYPGGGNYWSNWTSPDTMSGPLQNLPGSDGIVDDPLPIQGALEDPYPLTQPVSLDDTSVEFIATGLPNGASWTVVFNGTSSSTSANALTFSTNAAAHGVTLPYTVDPPSGWSVNVPTGSVVTNGGPLTVFLAFSAVTYGVTFTQTGLLAGTPWSVTINGTSYSGNSGSVTTSLPNGTYNYTVDPVAGYTVAPASGSITIASAGSSTPLTFSAVEYTVDFTEHGLPEGTTWSVTFAGQQKSLPSATISFAIANGSYAYAIGNVSGYSVAGGSGTQTVAGPGASVQIAFTANSSSGFGSSSPLFWALIAAIAILAVALVAVLLVGRRKPPASASAWTPPATSGASGAPAPPPSPAGGAPTPPPGATGNPPDWKE